MPVFLVIILIVMLCFIAGIGLEATCGATGILFLPAIGLAIWLGLAACDDYVVIKTSEIPIQTIHNGENKIQIFFVNNSIYRVDRYVNAFLPDDAKITQSEYQQTYREITFYPGADYSYEND